MGKISKLLKIAKLDRWKDEEIQEKLERLWKIV